MVSSPWFRVQAPDRNPWDREAPGLFEVDPAAHPGLEYRGGGSLGLEWFDLALTHCVVRRLAWNLPYVLAMAQTLDTVRHGFKRIGEIKKTLI
jgi:hypothetical protein